MPRLALCLSTLPLPQLTPRNAVRNTQLDASCSLSSLKCRSYSVSGKAPVRENSNLSSSSSSQPKPEVTWVTILESTAQAPFLKQRPPNPESALRRAFMLFYQVILSLNTLGNPEAASHLLLVSYCRSFTLVPFKGIIFLGIQNCPRFSHFRCWACSPSNSCHYFHYRRRHILHPALRSCS